MSCFNISGDMALNEDETDAVFVSDEVAILQQIKTGAQVFRNTWHYNLDAGIDYLEDIFVKNPDLRLLRTLFWQFLANIPGVTRVATINLRIDNSQRILYVEYEVFAGLTRVIDTIALQY